MKPRRFVALGAGLFAMWAACSTGAKDLVEWLPFPGYVLLIGVVVLAIVVMGVWIWGMS